RGGRGSRRPLHGDRGARLRHDGHLHRRRGAREHAWRRRRSRSQGGGAERGDSPAHEGDLRGDEALGRPRLPDAGPRAGRRHDAARVRGLLLGGDAPRLGGAGGTDARDRRPVRRGRRGAHRRRGNRPPLQPRRPPRARGRARRQHAGRGGLLLAGRGLRGRRDRVFGVSGLLSEPRGRGRAAPVRGREDRRGERRLGRGVPARPPRRRRGRAAARRVRHRLQPRHPEPHAEHVVRREDRGHGPLRDRPGLRLPRGDERKRRPLGHGQGPAAGRPDRARRRARPGERAVALLTLSTDPRVDAYAKLLVERCLDVRPGMQVLIRTTPQAAPAVFALERELARKGATPILRIGFVTWPTNPAWAAEAPEELLGELAEIDRLACDHMDARITMDAPENTRDGSDLAPERFQLVKKAENYFYRRSMSSEIPWVSCAYPTEALAQAAGMSLAQFEDVLYGACLIDWDA